MLNHWEKLTSFLLQAGAPLDNKVREQALKKAILHRKNALFYRTANGACVGDRQPGQGQAQVLPPMEMTLVGAVQFPDTLTDYRK